METTFYHDDRVDRDAIKKMKSNMSLDFSSNGKTKQQKVGGGVLASPDLQMLKLASPELERMIIQHGMVTTTPTPTQFICPKFVTEEQEAYARGFVDALNELHQQQVEDGVADNEGPVVNTSRPNGVVSTAVAVPFTNSSTQAFAGGATAVSSASGSLPPYTTVSLPGSVVSTSNGAILPTHHQLQVLATGNAGVNRSESPFPPASSLRVMQLKEEPQSQIVPQLGLGNAPPLSPINMVHQEGIKLDRKRARNRVAARKCRTRKLERISRLEDRVSELKGHNNDLSDTATKLRDQVCKLKQQIMDHVGSGCQVMMSQNLL